MYVCRSVWNNLALTGRFWLHFIFQSFFFLSKICWENSSFVKMRQEQRVLHMNVFSHLWRYLAKFFLVWEMFQIKVAENTETHILSSTNSFFFENRAVYEIMSKSLVVPEGPQMTIGRMRFVCRVRLHARARTHAHTHTHTEKYLYVILIAFPLQQCSRERASVLRHKHIACLVSLPSLVHDLVGFSSWMYRQLQHWWQFHLRK